MTVVAMKTDNNEYDEQLAWAFPDVDFEGVPLGGRILVQLKRVSSKHKSGLILAPDAVNYERSTMQVGKVVALGALAFKKRETLEPWPEGAWVKVGDFVRIPRYQSDRYEIFIDNDPDPVIFATINDYEVIKLVDNPLKIKEYV